jgi:hypothetical protein
MLPSEIWETAADTGLRDPGVAKAGPPVLAGDEDDSRSVRDSRARRDRVRSIPYISLADAKRLAARGTKLLRDGDLDEVCAEIFKNHLPNQDRFAVGDSL